MLSTNSFWEPVDPRVTPVGALANANKNAKATAVSSEALEAPIMLRNLGHVMHRVHGEDICRAFAEKWKPLLEGETVPSEYWLPPKITLPPSSDSESESETESESESESESDVSDIEQVDEKEDPRLRMLRADAERTFWKKEYQDELMSILLQLWDDMGDYHQALSYIVAIMMLVIPTQHSGSVQEHPIYKLAYNMVIERDGFYRLRPCLRKEATVMAVDGYVLHEILEKHLPDLHNHMHKQGMLPETYFQRVRISLGVQTLPFSCIFPAVESFFEFGPEFSYKLLLCLLYYLKDRMMVATTMSKPNLFELVHLDMDAFRTAPVTLPRHHEHHEHHEHHHEHREHREHHDRETLKGHLVIPSADATLDAYMALCSKIVESARAHCMIHHNKPTTFTIPEDLSQMLDQVDTTDWNVASQMAYDKFLRKRQERAAKDEQTRLRLEEKEMLKKAAKVAARRAKKDVDEITKGVKNL
jgi:hypothetical protein